MKLKHMFNSRLEMKSAFGTRSCICDPSTFSFRRLLVAHTELKEMKVIELALRVL